MKVLVVDDEPVARRRLVDMLESIGGIEVAGEAGDTVAARAFLAAARPDVVLLDIRMPGEDGMSFAMAEPDLPPIIFTTAYDDHAVSAFEACAVDYLLKPVRRQRLERALARVPRGSAHEGVASLERLLSREGEAPAARIRARQGDTTFLFDAREIARFHAADKYTCFHHEDREYLLEESLSALDARLGGHGFLRVHRSELVSLRHVRALRADEGSAATVELSTGERARVSRRSLPVLRRALRAD